MSACQGSFTGDSWRFLSLAASPIALYLYFRAVGHFWLPNVDFHSILFPFLGGKGWRDGGIPKCVRLSLRVPLVGNTLYPFLGAIFCGHLFSLLCGLPFCLLWRAPNPQNITLKFAQVSFAVCRTFPASGSCVGCGWFSKFPTARRFPCLREI